MGTRRGRAATRGLRAIQFSLILGAHRNARSSGRRNAAALAVVERKPSGRMSSGRLRTGPRTLDYCSLSPRHDDWHVRDHRGRRGATVRRRPVSIALIDAFTSARCAGFRAAPPVQGHYLPGRGWNCRGACSTFGFRVGSVARAVISSIMASTSGITTSTAPSELASSMTGAGTMTGSSLSRSDSRPGVPAPAPGRRFAPGRSPILLRRRRC